MRYSYAMHALIIGLLFLAAGCAEDDPVTPQDTHEEAIGMALFRGDSLAAAILRGIPSDTLTVGAGNTSEDYNVRFYSESEALFDAHDDGKTFSWEIENVSIVDIVQDSGKEGKFEFRLHGLTPGTTTIEFFILHEGHADFRSGKWPVRVS